MIVDELLFRRASLHERGLFKVVMWSGSFVDDFVIGTDASKGKGSKLLADMCIPELEAEFEEIYGVYGFISAVVGKMRGEKILQLAREHSAKPFLYKIEPARSAKAHLKDSVPLIHADAVHKRGVLGEGVKVGVIDTGVDASCSLRSKVISYRNFVPEEEYGDYSGHGTHVAGIIAGDEEVYRGVAPKAKIISAKVLNRMGEGDEQLIADGMLWACMEGAEILNLSLGIYLMIPGRGIYRGEGFLDRICDALTHKGIVIVVSAGNEGPEEGTIGSPACSKEVITVGAVDKHRRLASYSSRGTVGGITKPDLVAPGGTGGSRDEGIISVRSQLASESEAYPDECHTYLCGTSMAAPHVSGAAALILEAVGKRGIVVPNRHFFVKKVLMESATDLGYRRNEQGTGLVNVDKALSSVGAYSTEKAVSESIAQVTNDLASVLVPGAILGTLALLIGTAFNQEQDDRRARIYYQKFYSQVDEILRALEGRIHALNQDYIGGTISPLRYSEEMMKTSRILLELNELIKKIEDMKV